MNLDDSIVTSSTSSTSSTSFAIPTFDQREPGPDQRWSTWTAVTPSQRGPRPYPDWVITDSAAWDTELGILKTGKEADVHLIERAIPDDPGRRVVLAAKRYRGPEISDFHRSSQYTEGRRMKNTRDARAVASASSYGRAVSAGRWAHAEFEALCTLSDAGLPVPYPVQVNGTELLMEFIGDAPRAAPRLAQIRDHGAALADLFDQVAEIALGFARVGFAHGDLSAYNLLVHRGRVIVIDLPQLVEVVSNPTGLDLLHRDCVNVCDWFTRRGLERDAEELFARALGELW